ncbi:FecCD family ABC transporter permease [Thalassorhabdomicrobium marinisediminis]|uniref:Iron ABC transporter permease n=1 Tax=Thalassorhabdomicrobium marinisediminis TaxID=2170577 RepID=A0A2T7FVB0_9RHOB|nr:iron ABC transporter permease [Thalassorhabdomicrobium marinisediminis]PVA06095.1 iron ABC transporter permease [Thalassorhabdomicrobium marinisediminis]
MTRAVALTNVAALALILALLAGVFFGTADVSWGARWAALTGAEDAPRSLTLILWDWRLPRVLAVATVGASLALAGVMMQTVLHNPLADPYLMGLSSGASAAAVGAILWLPSWVASTLGVPLIAFAGAVCAFVMTLGLSFRRGTMMSPLVVILAGVAVSLMFQSLTAFFLYVGDPRATRSALGWLMGTAAGIGWADLWLPLIALGLVTAYALARAQSLDAVLLGDERAMALGLPIRRLRLFVFAAVALLAGLSVATVGIVGFIGLIVPHMARLLVGGRHRALIPLSLVLGALVLVIVDLLCRVILAPEELPLGVLLAIFAAPPFILILRRVRHAY